MNYLTAELYFLGTSLSQICEMSLLLTRLSLSLSLMFFLLLSLSMNICFLLNPQVFPDLLLKCHGGWHSVRCAAGTAVLGDQDTTHPRGIHSGGIEAWLHLLRTASREDGRTSLWYRLWGVLTARHYLRQLEAFATFAAFGFLSGRGCTDVALSKSSL